MNLNTISLPTKARPINMWVEWAYDITFGTYQDGKTFITTKCGFSLTVVCGSILATTKCGFPHTIGHGSTFTTIRSLFSH
jgi:hypothetical protein